MKNHRAVVVVESVAAVTGLELDVRASAKTSAYEVTEMPESPGQMAWAAGLMPCETEVEIEIDEMAAAQKAALAGAAAVAAVQPAQPAQPVAQKTARSNA